MTATGVIGPLPTGGTRTGIVRRPSYAITSNSTAITSIFSARTSLGFDLEIGQAVVYVPVLDASYMQMWAYVTINLWATSAGITDFEGWITELDYTFWPRAVGLVCSGLLVRAKIMENPNVGGTDLVGGSGATDQAIVTSVLGTCGLVMGGGVNGTINGTGATLGTKARQNYLWAEGESGLAYIQRLDQACMGYRTFDDVAGQINRKLISSVPSGSPVATFTEGLDIESGSTKKDILGVKNRAVVTGFDDGGGAGPVYFALQQASTSGWVPTPPTYMTKQVSSPLLERGHASEPGPGLACEDLATYTLLQTNRLQVRTSLVTPRDDLISPGDTVVVQAAGGTVDRLGVSGSFFVQHVDRELTEAGEFTQTLQVLQGVP